ncbi:polysaccharide deacetylase family protein [Jiella pelagia]|uniref:Chitooligosaccharide deacetylase n=1 Tax=Jiella pelagia TaxID=2986949 RepID=A0ABY7BXU7_9HYPH|nr:polysaccharide deacetylase family protein [Jiella pelagia]WAP67806.1 polysaccharide deacetylase family protein [Jiella pelagia]
MSDHLTRDFVGYGANPPDPQWPGGAKLALNFVINVEEGGEPSVPDGDAATEASLTEAGGDPMPGRNLAAETMFEYGSRVGFWRIARLFTERGLPATAMACGLALERNPQIATFLREADFDACAHGWRWEHHRLLSREEEKERIARTVAAFRQHLGAPPAGWYCRYGPSLNTRALLVEHGGFLYDSDAYNDELPYWTTVGGMSHLVVPYSLVTNDAKFIRGGTSTAEDFFVNLKDAFDWLRAEGASRPKMMSVGLHLRVAGHPGRAAGLARFLDYASRHDDVWICRRDAIARHWRTRHPPVT